MKKTKVGIVGCGFIGASLAEIISKKYRKCAQVDVICDLHQEKVDALAAKLRHKIKRVPLKHLIRSSDFIIEAASASISNQVAAQALSMNKQVMILSAGGLLRKTDWVRALKKSRGRIWIPSGAVAGIDGLLAAQEAGLKEVTLKIKKSPQGLQDAPYFKKRRFPHLRGNQEKMLFRGQAADAVKQFPKNANISAVLSLAGMGGKRTRVEVWTSRRYRMNQHEVMIRAKSGSLRYEIKNLPSRLNPRTSALAVYSAAAMLKKIFSPLRIGT